ncbi:unnamed protein product [Rotaria sp. Silwood1]|nr:unnamed protein product [Rotaria sp. Silwood1]
MAKYRNNLVQFADTFFITDGGLETILIFDEGIELPEFAAFVLFKDEDKREWMRNYLRTYHLALTIQNDAARYFQKLNMNITRRLLIGRMDMINIECKQQEIKVDTNEGLVDSLTIQIILSTSCLRRLIITFSTLMELFYGHKTIEEKNFIKQTDIVKLIDLIQEIQTKLSNNIEELTDELLLGLLQIRIYLSMFRLGSNYSVQVY